MSSIIEGYNYDIFISYRQKDNKGDRWVSEFVEALKTELESTFKEEISVYFDINPHDGLLETHDVDASLKEKLKCLVFIPIISRTYCDPMSFAWKHEFKAFVELASSDELGLKVKLPNGNVASRVLPVLIHDLDAEDIKLCESVTRAVLRGVDFIYKSPGVNRPLRAREDKPHDNINNIIYRDQINKIANAVKEIFHGIKSEPGLAAKGTRQTKKQVEEGYFTEEKTPKANDPVITKRKIISSLLVLSIIIIAALIFYPRLFSHNSIDRVASSGERITIAIMPFQNMTNDTSWNIWQVGVQNRLISFLSNTPELKVSPKEFINNLLKGEGHDQYASIVPSVAGRISKKLGADIYILGNILKAGNELQVDAQLIDTKTQEVLKSFEKTGEFKDEAIFALTDTLRKQITDFLLLKKVLKENPFYGNFPITTNSPEAFRCFIYGKNAEDKGDFATAEYWLLKAIAIDSNYFDARGELPAELGNQGKQEQDLYWILKNYKEKDRWNDKQQMWVNWAYSYNFEPPEEQIKWLKKIEEVDDQATQIPYLLGITYMRFGKHEKAIPEFKKAIETSCKINGWKEYGDDMVWVNANLGWSYIKTGKYKEAKILYKKVERECKDQKAFIYSWIVDGQAMLALVMKDSISANSYFEKYISILKENSVPEATISSKVGDIYFGAGMIDKGEEFYRKALSTEPENPDRLNALAWALIVNNRKLDEAMELVEKALKSCPDSSRCFQCMDTKGWCLYKQGKYKEALELYEKIWEQRPFYSYYIYSHIEEVKRAFAGQNDSGT